MPLLLHFVGHIKSEPLHQNMVTTFLEKHPLRPMEKLASRYKHPCVQIILLF